MARVSTETTKNIAVDLRERIDGRVIGPEDGAYNEARTVFYGGFDRHPAAIAFPKNAKDVAAAIDFARQCGYELAVRSGGHSVAGHSASEGGLVIDLREMKALEIDPVTRTAWAQTGLTAGEYTNAAGTYQLATGFGDTGSVGIGGITLGGGVGYLVRKYGLTIDNLLAAEVVTADGQIRNIDEKNHPDLFWAVRGGGGNFGVATRFKYQLQPVSDIFGGMLILPATPEVIANIVAEADAAPEELSAIFNVMSAPPMPFIPAEAHGQLIVFAMMVYAGDLQSGEQALAPFRKVAKPIADMLRPMRYPEMFPHEEGGYHPTAVSHNMFVDKIDLDDARSIRSYLESSDAPMRVAQLRVLGGAVERIPVEATAYAHRKAKIMVNLAAFYSTPQEKSIREAWVADFASALDQGYEGAYVNFVDKNGPEGARSAYPGKTWDRLAAIKSRYDPENLFRMNHNVLPAGQTA